MVIKIKKRTMKNESEKTVLKNHVYTKKEFDFNSLEMKSEIIKCINDQKACLAKTNPPYAILQRQFTI